jgi:hypothetical protein
MHLNAVSIKIPKINLLAIAETKKLSLDEK